LRQTKEAVLADPTLRLIGSAKELSGSQRFGPGIVTVVLNESQRSGSLSVAQEPTPKTDPEIARRANLLAAYRAATQNPSNRQIYESKNSGIHKPQFYKWLRGELPSSSATTAAFERFLAAKKPPIPRRPKT
jgi:hypothetical protein